MAKTSIKQHRACNCLIHVSVVSKSVGLITFHIDELFPTGDPIEVSAAYDVLISNSPKAFTASHQVRTAPVLMASSKSFLGHAEPSAGIVGLLHASFMLHHHQSPPIAHLRQLNPYVQSVFEAASNAGAATAAARGGLWAIPKQPAGLPSVVAHGPHEQQTVLAIGTSAFAFQVGQLLCCLAP
jgi:hypothetical protein